MPSNWNRVRWVDSGFFSVVPLGLPDKNPREKLSIRTDAPDDPAPDDVPHGSPERRVMASATGAEVASRGRRGVAGWGHRNAPQRASWKCVHWTESYCLA